MYLIGSGKSGITYNKDSFYNTPKKINIINIKTFSFTDNSFIATTSDNTFYYATKN